MTTDQTIIDAYVYERLSTHAARKRFGIGQHRAARLLREADLMRHHRIKDIKPKTLQFILRHRRKGMTICDIAQEIRSRGGRISESTVRRIVREHGLPRRVRPNSYRGDPPQPLPPTVNNPDIELVFLLNGRSFK